MNRPKPKTAEQLAKEVATFNQQVKEGDTVIVTMDDKSTVETVTESEAFVMGGHSAMVRMSGIRGAYLLDRVKKK